MKHKCGYEGIIDSHCPQCGENIYDNKKTYSWGNVTVRIVEETVESFLVNSERKYTFTSDYFEDCATTDEITDKILLELRNDIYVKSLFVEVESDLER